MTHAGQVVWITRAQPGAARTADRVQALGFTPLIAPLLAVQSLSPSIDLDGMGSLAFTSVNGVASFAALSVERDLPVFAVGDATAQAARDAGFATVVSASGDVEDLERAIAALTQGDVAHVLIHSPRAGLVLAGALAGRTDAVPAIALCLSPAVAATIPARIWREIRIAARPDEDALLALLGKPHAPV